MEDDYKPQAVSTAELIIEYYMKRQLEEQRKTNALLEQLLKGVTLHDNDNKSIQSECPNTSECSDSSADNGDSTERGGSEGTSDRSDSELSDSEHA